jgi:hypothetical protein
MYVTGADSWIFMSYQRGLPKLVLEVERDEEAQEALAAAIDGFNERLDVAWERLVALSGGPPKRAAKPEPTPPTPEDDGYIGF